MGTGFHDSLLSMETFGRLYEKYYSMLCIIAFEYTRDKYVAEEMVSETFLLLWEKRETIVITTSVKYYMIKSVKNTCMQYIRRKSLKTQSLNDEFSIKHIPWGEDYPLGRLFEKELLEMIGVTIQSLPEQCRRIFLLSRDDELSYPQIAKRLHISENTVKTQIKTALSRLRIALKDYLTIFFLSLLSPYFSFFASV